MGEWTTDTDVEAERRRAERARAYSSLFDAQDGVRDFFAMVEGEVAQLKGNGFTDEQARAIVAFMFGWRPANGSTPEGREGL